MLKKKENPYYRHILKKSLTGVKRLYNSFFYRYRTQLIVLAIVLTLALTVTAVLADFTKRNDYSVDQTTIFVMSRYSTQSTSSVIRLIHGPKRTTEAFLQQVDVRTIQASQLQGFLKAFPYNGVVDDSAKLLFFLVDEEGRLIKVYTGATEARLLREDLVNYGYLEEPGDE